MTTDTYQPHAVLFERTINARTISSASASMIVPTVNEAETRCASNAWDASVFEPAAANTATRMPSPSEPPSWWATLTRPEATRVAISQAAVKSARPTTNMRRMPRMSPARALSKEQNAESERIDVLHPGELDIRKVESVMNLRKPGDDDGDAGHDHEIADENHREHRRAVRSSSRHDQATFGASWYCSSLTFSIQSAVLPSSAS